MIRRAAAWLLLACGGCAGTPSVGGVAGVPSAPNTAWSPPASLTRAADTVSPPPVPPDLEQRIRRLTLADVVDIGLRNNPATRLSWANARAAAAYGSERGAFYPTVDGDVSATRIKTTASQGRSAVTQSVFTPSVSISYLVLDFGGRSGNIGTARNELIATNLAHNASLQAVVLDIQRSYFEYIANQALLAAQRTTVTEANANLSAAEERHRVGVAAIADVLQARTAASEAGLLAEVISGRLQTARGALALSLGIPANLPYDVDTTAANVPVGLLTDSVDVLIVRAVQARPDLAAAKAEFDAAKSQISVARASRLPSLTLDGNAGRTYTQSIPQGSDNYAFSLGLRIPLFAGFSRLYDQRRATAFADAAAARADALGQQVVFEVFSSYHALQTAARRVRSSEDLIASARQSNEVALGRYKAGVGSVLDLLAAQSALAQARAQEILARLEWNTSLAQLARDAGVLDISGGNSLRLVPDSAAVTPP